MPTQDERLTTLEQAVALLQNRSSVEVKDLNRNTTILLGIASGQELDIKEIKISLMTMDQQLGEIRGDIKDLHSRLDEHTTLLTQILERLPKAP